MRIISQDGNVDLPYESIVIVCAEGIVSAEVNSGKRFCVGVYSTQEKARAAIKELRKSYLKCNAVNVAGASGGGPSTYGFVKNRVFIFPPDEEVAL